ncbi:hypothetical protein BGZ76_010916 [Entomortierella beljakovae]|nr:hypothetical protein BGZ76_010916 [Entomortierella beljakovae]
MTEFAQEHPTLRSRGPSLPKLNLLPATHFLQQHQHYSQSQHPFDSSSKIDDNDFDIDMDMDMDFDTTPVSTTQEETSRPFVSTHPSPDTSDESDCELNQSEETHVSSAGHINSAIAIPTTSTHQKNAMSEHHQLQSESPLSHHIFLTSVPIPKSTRTPPHSPLNYRQRSSFSNTPPGSASSVLPTPCSDPMIIDALIREHVCANMISHGTNNSFFWNVGKLSEFSFSDRFVRSRLFEIKDNTISSSGTSEADKQNTNSWRLRLYPHGRGDRHRDCEYVGLYLQQETVRPSLNRRSSAISGLVPIDGFCSSAPTPFVGRGSFSQSPRKSISGAFLTPVRRHVTLFIATEEGDCLVKQDLIEWFSGGEGGLGFPSLVSRKTILDAAKKLALTDIDEDVESELDIVAGVIFHEL